MEMDKAVAVLETSLFPLCPVFLCMFVRLRVRGFESSVNKVFQKEKLVNSKTINLQPSVKGVSSARTKLVQLLINSYFDTSVEQCDYIHLIIRH